MYGVAALQAVRMDEKNCYAHYSLAIVAVMSDELVLAARAAEKAIEVSPSFALGHLALGMARLYAGCATDAQAPLRQGLQLNAHDPHNFVWTHLLALAQLFAMCRSNRCGRTLCLRQMRFALAVPYCAVLIVVAIRRRSLESGLVAGAATMAVSWSAFTYYAHPGDALSWVPFGNVPLYLIVTWALVLRFARSLDEAESLGVELADRVEAKRVELEANYGRLAELESRQAVVAERARLMSDMHDGIGGQLISTLSLVEGGDASKEQVCAALRECIDDLRLVIDSLEPIDDELLPVLGNLRYRLQPRLEAHGIELDWHVRDVPKLECLTPQNVLHVLRILQEALTNVVKHSGARHIRVQTRVEEERIAIDVSDDGIGFADQNAPRGRGLESMRRRANALGADLAVQTSPSGTMITLVLPAH